MGERVHEKGIIEEAIDIISDAGGEPEITVGGLKPKKLETPGY